MTAYSSITPPEGKAYGIGKIIEVTVNFDGNAWAIPGPSLQPYILLTNGTVIYPTSRIGQGTPSITFRYTVVEGHASTGVNYFAAWNTFYADEALTELIDTSTATAAFSNVVVDGIRPTIESVSGPQNPRCPVGKPMIFKVTFSEAVLINGFPRLMLAMGTQTTKRRADYLSGVGTNELEFSYVPSPTDTAFTQITAVSPLVAGLHINDEAENAAVLAFSPVTFSGLEIAPPPERPTVSLTNDTGRSDRDKVTNDASLTVSNGDPSCEFEYSTDGGASWGQTYAVHQGKNAVRVRAVDPYGERSKAREFVFTYDTVAPSAPEIGLVDDTGWGSSDEITRDPTIAYNPLSVEKGAKVEYSLDEGETWVRSLKPNMFSQGVNEVWARQVDVAGNASAHTTLSFVLDSSRPATPGIALSSDTGISNTDKITSNGSLTTSGIVPSCQTQYSFNGGGTWGTTFSAAEGQNNVLIRQVDAAGNESLPGRLAFRLVTAGPASPVVVMRDSEKNAATKVYADGSTAFVASGLGKGETLQYSTGSGWSSTFTPQPGTGRTVQIRTVDIAGNPSPTPTTLTYDYNP